MTGLLNVPIPEKKLTSPKKSSEDSVLLKTYIQIAECLELDEDWDGEGGLPVSQATVAMANNIVTSIFANQRVVSKWVTPSVTPDPNGRIVLLWRLSDQRVRVILEGTKDDTAIFIRTPITGIPVREVLSLQHLQNRLMTLLA